MSAFDQIRDVYFGTTRAPMRLSPEERRRVLWTSLAPAVIVLAVLVSTAISIYYSSNELADESFASPNGNAPFLVRRVYTVAVYLPTLEFLALALLFAAGLQTWTRAEGSWMIIIGTALLAIALVCGAFVVGTFAVLGRDDHGVRTNLWINIAHTFGLMAVGYFFLAYRGATAEEDDDGEGNASEPT